MSTMLNSGKDLIKKGFNFYNDFHKSKYVSNFEKVEKVINKFKESHDSFYENHLKKLATIFLKIYLCL